MQTNKTTEKKVKKAQIAEKAKENDLWVISEYLMQLKFSPRVMGVDEADVWKKIEKLCELYENTLKEERAKNRKLTKQLNECALKLKNLVKATKTEATDGK